VRPLGETVESADCLVGEWDISNAPALGRALDVVREGALDDQHALAPAHVAPAQRDELTAAQAGVGGDPEQIAELAVLRAPELVERRRLVRGACPP
jgi:hypothetical protein